MFFTREHFRHTILWFVGDGGPRDHVVLLVLKNMPLTVSAADVESGVDRLINEGLLEQQWYQPGVPTTEVVAWLTLTPKGLRS